jgi:Sulfotransferase family
VAAASAILARTGKRRWCELATASPADLGSFLQVFPQAAIVCVHRRSLYVISAGLQTGPSDAAALAACWAHATEQLLAFEVSKPEATHRVRYEDVAADPSQALAAVRESLKLNGGDSCAAPVESTELAAGLTVPVEQIPEPLRARISRLHGKLGYAPL